jgi:acetolactate synthase-1/2/3 large subunit
VVAFTGDAGFFPHLAEVETAVRKRINAVIVVNDDGGGNQSEGGFNRAYDGHEARSARDLWTVTRVNPAKVAEDLGPQAPIPSGNGFQRLRL